VALLNPVVGKLGHSVDTSQAHSGFLVAELVSGGRVSLGELLRIGSAGVSLDKALFAVTIDADEDGTDEPRNGNRGLYYVERVDNSWPAVGSRMWYSNRS